MRPRRRAHGLLELLLAVSLLGGLLVNLPWPAPRGPPPDPGPALVLVMDQILREVAASAEVLTPRTSPRFPVSSYQRGLRLPGVEYRFHAGRLKRRGEPPPGPRPSYPEVALDQAWFQVRNKGVRGQVVRVRLVRGDQVLLSAAVAQPEEGP